jgi:hypothetical protein
MQNEIAVVRSWRFTGRILRLFRRFSQSSHPCLLFFPEEVGCAHAIGASRTVTQRQARICAYEIFSLK